MFTPTEIQEKMFKTGLGYDKKDVEQFLQDLSSDYAALLKDIEESNKKVNEQNETIAYYKSIEKTLQKALILAEKTAQDTRATALREAEATQKEARTTANSILAEAKRQNEMLEHKTLNLMQQYDLFKIHFENLLNAQLKLLNSKSFLVNTDDFTYKESSYPEKLKESMEAITQDAGAALLTQESTDQPSYDFLKEDAQSTQTEDGFEFFTVKED